jgi:hypothetical protein
VNIAVATYLRLYVRPMEKHELELVTSTCTMSCNVLLQDCTRHRFEPTTQTTATFEDNDPRHTLPEHVKILVEMHRITHDCVKAAQAHMQESTNRQRLPIPFTVGDKAKLKAANLRFVQQPCSKLRDCYIGPFLITEEVSPVAFRLKLPP